MGAKTVLVTGVNGFVGPHLARELVGRKCEVWGVGFQSAADTSLENVLKQYTHCDLTNQADVEKIDFSNVAAVIHLAGLSSQGMSFEQPARFIADNSAMLISLFETALKQKPAKLPRFVVVSSGVVYASDQKMPLNEDSRVASTSPYAVSKLTVEHLCDYYRTRGFDCVVARPFNHTGPGQGPGFLIPDLTAQVLKAGPDGTVEVGNLKTRRDFSDVRDIVRAYGDMALADKLKHPLFNLCSGTARSGQEVLDLIIKEAFDGKAKITVSIDKSRIRPNDPPEIYGDHSRAKGDFGWKPALTVEDTIRDYVAWLRSQK